MLSVIDITRALSALVETNFPNYPVNDRDIEEGFARPSFFIDIDNIKTTLPTAEYTQETTDIQLFFFAEDRYQGFLDLLQMKNALLPLLTEPLAIASEDKTETAHVVFDDVEIEISKADKAMKCTFTSELIQGIVKTDDTPYIDTLVYQNNLYKEV